MAVDSGERKKKKRAKRGTTVWLCETLHLFLNGWEGARERRVGWMGDNMSSTCLFSSLCLSFSLSLSLSLCNLLTEIRTTMVL